MEAMKVLAVVAGLVALAGCGGSGDVDDEVRSQVAGDTYMDRAEGYSALEQSFSEQGFTAFDAMPVAGSARYEGYSGIIMEEAGGTSAFVGSAEVVADFGSGRIHGQATDFVGTVRAEPIKDIEGALSVSGTIGQDFPNDVDAVVSGRLSGGGHEVSVEGGLDGMFSGTPVAGVELVSAPGSVVGILDGDAVPTTVGVIAGR